MSVSTVYEHPELSPKWCVRVHYPDHTAVHRFHTEADAEAFRLGALEGPDRLETAVAKANEAISAGEAYPCIVALVDLTAAVEARMMALGRA